jgi:hypothetical protein
MAAPTDTSVGTDIAIKATEVSVIEVPSAPAIAVFFLGAGAMLVNAHGVASIIMYSLS